jgi:curved DNA-binding protein CbpA
MALPPSELPDPSAEGTLAKTPFPHLLVYAHDRQLTGTIVLSGAGGAELATILFIEGQPMKARTAEPVAYLGRVLLELGYISESALNFSLRKLAEQKKLHGQILLAAGSLKQDQLVDGLRVQLVRKLQSLVHAPPDTVFRYYDGFDALHAFGGDDSVPIDAHPIIWAAIREAPPWEHVHSALTRIGTAGLRVGDGANLGRFGFDRDEQTVVDLLRARGWRMHELSGIGKLSPRLTQLLVYCLLITKQVELVRESQLPPPPESSTPDPPSSSRRVLPTEPPLSPSAQAVAKLALQQAKAAKARGVVEAKAEGLPWDDRHTPPPANVLGLVPNSGRSSKPTPAPSALRAPVVIPTPGAFVPSRASQPANPPQPSAPPTSDPVYTKATQPSMGAIRDKPAEHTEAPGAPGTDLPPGLASHRKEILERAGAIEKQNYFEMLGLSLDSTPEEARATYLALAKTWHPDRLPPGLAEMKAQCARIFAHMSEAHQTLTDREKRERYMLLLREGGATPESQAEIAAVIGAATDFQKAEIFLKRNDLAQAEAHCRKALEADPLQADYHVLLAWLESQKPSMQSASQTEELIARITKALEKSPRCERGYFYRGMLHKRVGHEAAAARDFRKASELNPRNIDAQREVRIFEMRKGGVSTPTGSKKKDDDKNSSLFGKLFKK